MRRQSSILALAARGSLGRAVLALLVTGAAGAAVFAVQLHRQTVDAWTPALESLLDGRLFRLTMTVGLLAVTAAACFSGGGRGSRPDNTAARLPRPLGQIVAAYAVYGLLLYALVWAFQLGLVLGLCRLYDAWAGPEMQNGQTAFLAAYRSGVFHSLLPMADGGRWLASALLYGGLAISSASAAVRSWSGKWPVGPLVVAALTWFNAGGVGTLGWQLLLGAASVIVAGTGLSRLREEVRPV